ncbi:MAG: hypothetical protein K6U03_02395 [Firmicutes bacterium]|nr:hypothetical protein [Bacillota bacterium]
MPLDIVEIVEAYRARAEVRRLAKVLVQGYSFGVKKEAHDKLREMGPERPGWVDTLREALYKGQDGLGWSAVLAAEALGRHGACVEEVATVMLKMLSAALARDDLAQAEIIILVLRNTFLKAADRMVAYLDRMAGFLTDPRVGDKMAEAFRMIYRRWPEAYRGMLLAYRQAVLDPKKREYAEALHRLVEEARAEAEAYTIGAVSEDPAERAAAAARLGASGCASNLVLQTLLWLTGDPDGTVRAAAHKALARLGVDEEYNQAMAVQ